MRKTTEIEVTRQIARATPEQVYDVWIDPSSPGSPFESATKSIVASVVDGLFYTELAHADTIYTHYGRFTQLERARVVAHTWVSAGTKGYESIVTTTFEARDGGTFIRLRHTGLPDDEDGRNHVIGWEYTLASFADGIGKTLAAG